LDDLSDLSALGTRRETPFAEQALRSHDMQDENLVSVIAVEDTTRWLYNLAVARPPQLLWPTATLRMIHQLFNVTKDALDERRRRNRILQRDVIGNGIQIA
jgi:hypothetical protein